MLEGRYGKNNTKTEKIILKKVFDSGRHYLEGKWWTGVYKNVLPEMEKAKRHGKFNQLQTFLGGYKRDFLYQKMFSIMKKYKLVEAELLPILLNQKCGLESKGLSSSPDWTKIEKIYGDFYELYGDLLLIPTTINNLLVRDDIQRFATEGFTLIKYLDTDKAGRTSNF